MKKNKSLMWSLLVASAVLIGLPAFAQDDLYYDPATDATYTPAYDDNTYREDSKITQRYKGDDGYYEDEYAYEYSSRIRRFHQPVQTIDYYDPFFVDLWFYDPFYLPGATIYVGGYNDYWRWRRWNRWHRYNSWSFYDPYWGGGFNSGAMAGIARGAGTPGTIRTSGTITTTIRTGPGTGTTPTTAPAMSG